MNIEGLRDSSLDSDNIASAAVSPSSPIFVLADHRWAKRATSPSRVVSPTPIVCSAPDSPVWLSSLAAVSRQPANALPQDRLHRSSTGCNGEALQLTGRRLSRPGGGLRRATQLSEHMENAEIRCCRISVLLVYLQLALGATISALGFYLETLTSSLKVRECPYWAGMPLLVSGVFGAYYAATNFSSYAGSVKAFAVKTACFAMSFSCIFLCTVAAVFPGLHGTRIARYVDCQPSDAGHCECPLDDGEVKVYVYDDVTSCSIIFTSIKDYLILVCALSTIASGVSLWFVTLLWRSRYQNFHSGLRFYSYNASIPTIS